MLPFVWICRNRNMFVSMYINCIWENMQEYLVKSLTAKDQFLDSSAKIMYKLGISSSKIKSVFFPLLVFIQNYD